MNNSINNIGNNPINSDNNFMNTNNNNAMNTNNNAMDIDNVYVVDVVTSNYKPYFFFKIDVCDKHIIFDVISDKIGMTANCEEKVFFVYTSWQYPESNLPHLYQICITDGIEEFLLYFNGGEYLFTFKSTKTSFDMDISLTKKQAKYLYTRILQEIEEQKRFFTITQKSKVPLKMISLVGIYIGDSSKFELK